MLALRSTDDVLAAIRTASHVDVLAYTLRAGRIESALVAAAKRGAKVTVRLEGTFFNGCESPHDANSKAIERLERAGADAQLVAAPLHAKAIVAGASLYLDDRNFPDDSEDTIVQDDFARDRAMIEDAVRGKGEGGRFFTTEKRDALASEARLLSHTRAGEDVVLESESFGGYNRVYRELRALGDAGFAPRVLVSSRILENNPRERNAIARLEAHGVRVRAIDADEKFALAGSRGWLGSTNATAAFEHPDQIDWGARTDNGEIVAHLRDAFERRWANAVEVTAG